MTKKTLIHEATYKKGRAEALIHNNRLKTILRIFRKYLPAPQGVRWVDFGCSNGFICDEIVKTGDFNFSRITGYDHARHLLEKARARKIPNAKFNFIDLNRINDFREPFDLVTCFETLEHVGDFKTAFVNLVNALDDDGTMIIAIPNETGFPGIVKFLGRYALRRRPYGDFFSGSNPFSYFACLLKNGDIEAFRKPDQPGHGPHLGFDYRKFEEYIGRNFIQNNKMELVEKSYTSFRMNVIYVLKNR